MRIKYAELTTSGPIRNHNEDCLAFWEPEDPIKRNELGSVALLADGVGGEKRGDLASKLAVETALEVFKNAPSNLEPAKVLRQMFEAASMKVFDASSEISGKGRMATTLVASIFRSNRVTVGHVGDSRAYLIRQGNIRRLTVDHSYVSLQVRLGLVLERNAMTSDKRSILTRSVGHEPMCHADICTEMLSSDDIIVHCTDGVYGYVMDDELKQACVKLHPYDACKKLIGRAERRQTDDNASIQIIHVKDVEQVASGPRRTVKTNESAPTDEQLVPGFVLDGRFEITDLVARSGMAAIFKANDLEHGDRPVALKVPFMQFESDVAGFNRFLREEEIGIKLDHPFILKVIKFDGKSRPYIVMEFLEGQTLDDLLQNVHQLPEPDAAAIASRICDALDYMHRNNVVHRDLKPQNIMICNDGSIRIMDFGIAKATESRRLTFVGFTPSMGTPDYMAPEQVKGRRGDARTEIYNLGAILYEMTTGRVPFEGESPYVIMNARLTGDPEAPRKLNTKLTPVIEEIVLHALERNPVNRFQTAAEMKAGLDDYEKVELTDRFQKLQSPQPWKSRFQMLPLIIIFLVAQGLFFAFFLWYFRAPAKKGEKAQGTTTVVSPPVPGTR